MAKSKFTLEERKRRRRAYAAQWARNRRKKDPKHAAKLNKKQRDKREEPGVRDAERAQGRVRYSRRELRAKLLLKNAKTRAAMRGDELFSLTLAHVQAGIDRGFCVRTGYWFDFTAGVGINPRAPSLDRIDANGPYADYNVQVVCWQYNVMKQKLTDAQLLEFCKAVVAAP